MIKLVVGASSGITRKQVELLYIWEGYNFYALKQDIKNGKLDECGMLLVEHNNHLFYVDNYNRVKYSAENKPGEITEYMKDFEQKLIINLEKNIQDAKEHKSCWFSKGIAQYLNREQEVLEVTKEYRKWCDIEDEKKRIEKEQAELKHQQEEQEKLNASIVQAEQDIENGNKISADMFIELCNKYEVELPIKLKGWIYKSLIDIIVTERGHDGYSYRGKNPSTTIAKYSKQLWDNIHNTVTNEESLHLFGKVI